MEKLQRTKNAMAIIWIVSMLSISANGQLPTAGSPRKTAAVPQPRPIPKQTLNVSVLPFRQTVGSTETAALGAGISESLSNALKAVSDLIVTDGDLIVQAAAKGEPAHDLAKDDEAVLVGTQVNLQFIVTGSYQSIGSQLLIDARILNVLTGRPSGSTIEICCVALRILPWRGWAQCASLTDEYIVV